MNGITFVDLGRIKVGVLLHNHDEDGEWVVGMPRRYRHVVVSRKGSHRPQKSHL